MYDITKLEKCSSGLSQNFHFFDRTTAFVGGFYIYQGCEKRGNHVTSKFSNLPVNF